MEEGITRTLGLDIGDSRIGVALSDPLGILATPLKIINRDDDQVAIEEIITIVRKNEIGLVIAGLPLNMNGSEGPQAVKTRSFVTELNNSLEIPIEYRDERLSTVSARELLQGVRKTDNDTRYDAAAAAIILQGYLDRGKRIELFDDGTDMKLD